MSPNPFKLTLLSSINGNIKELLLVYSRSPIFKKFLRELIKKMPKVKFLIWVNNKDDKIELKKLLNRFDEVKYQILEDKETDFNFWIQDCFLVYQNNANSKRYLLEPRTRSYNVNLADSLEYYYKSKFKKMEFIPWLVLDGGNMLCNKDFVFIGAKDLERTERRYEMQNGKINGLKDKISELLKSNQVIIVKPNKDRNDCIWNLNSWVCGKNSSQGKDLLPKVPDVHIDMFMSLAGDRLIVLAEPDYQLIMNDTTDFEIHSKLLDGLRDIQKNFEEEGFRVIRNPVPIFKNRVGNLSWGYYNNCLVEITENSKTVWLPRYGGKNGLKELTEYDRQNRKLWKSEGFEVVFINADFVDLAERNGAIHCMVKVLKRN